MFDSEYLLANAVRFLIDGGEEDAASVLLSCSLKVWESGDTWYVGDEVHRALHVMLSGPRVAYDILNTGDPISVSIKQALEAVIPHDTYIKHFECRLQMVDIDPNWRAELLEIARGQSVHNQAAGNRTLKIRTWMNLNFRSESEVRIAQALDRQNVLFLPNCRARLGALGHRENREADFLICHNGKWGILEVDGELFHPPSRTVQDHERDRLFRAHGVRIVEHFDAHECFEDPDGVVARFLRILELA